MTRRPFQPHIACLGVPQHFQKIYLGLLHEMQTNGDLLWDLGFGLWAKPWWAIEVWNSANLARLKAKTVQLRGGID